MPKRSRYELVGALIIALLAGLAFQALALPTGYLPLSEGNTWNYTRWEKWELPPPGPTALSFPGAKTWPDDIYSIEYSASVTGAQTINGVATYIWDHGTGNAYALSATSTGIRCYGINGSTLPTYQFLLKTPPVKGAYWDFAGLSGPAFRITVESIADTIETSAGRFSNCVRVRLAYYVGQGPLSLYAAAALGTDYDLAWYAPSVGIVREEIYRGGKMTGWTVLDSFDFNEVDATSPPMPVLLDDGVVSLGNSLHAKWTCGDPESGISHYWLAVSTTPDEDGIVEEGIWENIGLRSEFTTPGMALVNGDVYYILLRAMNNAGIESELAVSDGIEVRLTPPNLDLFPMQIGNYWNYDVSAGYYEDYPGHVAVLSSALVNSVRQFDVETALDTTRSTISTLGKTTTGLVRYKVDGVAITTAQMLLKTPGLAGDTWQWSDASGATNCRIVSTNELVTVPAGTFPGCTLVDSYRASAPSKHDYVWYYPGVGVVKATTVESIVGGSRTLETDELNGWHVHSGPPDTTAPSKPIVTVGGTLFQGTDISARWSSTDAESGVYAYQMAVSTSTTEAGMVAGATWRNFGDATAGTLEDLLLQGGVAYYVLVRAINGAGTWSVAGASAAFKVEKQVISIVVSLDPTTVPAKAKKQFTATIYDIDGLPVLGKTLAWSCSAGGGTVTSTGLLTAGALVSNHTVTAALPLLGISGTAAYQIVPGPAAKVIVTPSSVSLYCADTQQFSAAVRDANGNSIPDAPIVWSISSKTLKAGTIDPVTGLFTAGPNPASYTAAVVAASGSIRGSALVKVLMPPPTTVRLFLGGVELPDSVRVKAGSLITFVAKGYDSLDRPIAGMKFAFAAVGTIGTISSTTGALTAGKIAGAAGTVSAQAVINLVRVGPIREVQVEIVPSSPYRIVVVPKTNTIAARGTLQYAAQVYDAYNNLAPDAQVRWVMVVAKAGTITTDGWFTAGLIPGTYTSAVKAVTIVGAKYSYGNVVVTAL